MEAKQTPRVQPGSREEMRRIRMSSNWVNMAIALGACMAVVVLLFAFTPRVDAEYEREVDFAGMAESAQASAEFTLAVPELDEGWVSNEASFDPQGTPQVDTWYVSWIGPDRQWITLRQAAGEAADDRWVASITGEDMLPIDTRDIAGTTFDVYQGGSGDRALAGSVSGTTVVLKGTASEESFESFAEKIVDSIDSVEG